MTQIQFNVNFDELKDALINSNLDVHSLIHQKKSLINHSFRSIFW